MYTLNTFVGADLSRMRLYRRLLALMPSKSEACYLALLRLIFESAAKIFGINVFTAQYQIRWRAMMCDFEPQQINAFNRFARVHLQLAAFVFDCCHMHYFSAVVKKLKEIGLTRAY